MLIFFLLVLLGRAEASLSSCLLLVFLFQLLLDRCPDESVDGLGGLEADARALKVLLLRERSRAVREQDVGEQLFLVHGILVVGY